MTIPSWFVITMGMGTVFVGLICIVLLIKILGAICSLFENNQGTESKQTFEAALPSQIAEKPNFANRQEVIAAIGTAIAEECGVGVESIRITSITRASQKPTTTNRQEVIAAIGVAIAEECGVDVDAIRITSIKKI